jgi:hypothetical protein
LLAVEDTFEIEISDMMLTKPGHGLSKPKASLSGAQKQAAGSAADSSSSGPSASQVAAQGQSKTRLTSVDDVFDESIKLVDAVQSFVSNAVHQFSSQIQKINDTDAEYVINVKKHFYDKYIIVQYGIKNTLEDQRLSALKMTVSAFETESNLKVEGIVALGEGDYIGFGDQKFVYIIINKEQCTDPYPLVKI